MKKFTVLANPRKVYDEMLRDISVAERFIYLETYIYDADAIGREFLAALIKKARRGVHVRLLIDAWGSSAKRRFFKELIEAGAEVKFFREFHFFGRVFSRYHERNHRKLLLIDGKTSYIGSMNITATCLKWRELVLRLEGSIGIKFVHAFMHSWESFGEFTKRNLKKLLHQRLEIIHDMPPFRQHTEKKYASLINKARHEVLIETPYFAPSRRVRKAISKAARRGARIKLILPYKSDVFFMDLVRNRYLGFLHQLGVEIFYYRPGTLHSKLLLVDDHFLLGSSNLDYRSFRHQYDINLTGHHPRISAELRQYFNATLSQSTPFSYIEWKNRSSWGKIGEIILGTFRRYL